VEQRVRTAAKAIIVRDGSLLVTANHDRQGRYYLLPGGGQYKGETLIEALERECWEEIGVHVQVDKLALVRDYIGSNHEFAAEDDSHQLELMFLCALPPGKEPDAGSAPDGPQTGFAWLPLSRLRCYRIYPTALAWAVPAVLDGFDRCPHYLGDVN